MIRLEDVRKTFGKQEVLKGISSTFLPGKVNMIIGASGSGKSVLMKALVGLHTITSGHIYYGDTDLANITDSNRLALRRQIGMLFQNSALFDSMTVEENVVFPLNMFSKESKSWKQDRVNFCLERVGLVNTNKKYPAEISGGMKKRVGIARAIVLNPAYLFVDEPNSGLDPLTSILIDELIKEITVEYQMTTLVNTHDMNSVMEIGDHIVYIYQGKKCWEGDKNAILTTDNEILNNFVFATNFLKDFKQRRN